MLGTAGSAVVSVGSVGWRASRTMASGAAGAFGKKIPAQHSWAVRAVYVVLFLVVGAVAFVLRMWTAPALNKIDGWSWFSQLDQCDHDRYCVGALAAYRVLFALASLHGILALLLLFVRRTSEARARLQDSWWSVKFLYLVVVTVALLFIPQTNLVFLGLSYVALAGAALFILVQLVLLLELAYLGAEWLLSRASDHRGWAVGVVVVTACLYGFAFVVYIALGVLYGFHPTCWYNAAILAVTVIGGLAVSLLSVLPALQAAHPHGAGLLQSGVVVAYSAYLLWSAVLSEPEDAGCSSLVYSSGSITSLLVGAAITIVTVCFTTVRTASRPHADSESDLAAGSQVLDPTAARLAPLDASVQQSASSSSSSSDEETGDEHKPLRGDSHRADDVDDVVRYSYSRFHLVFLLGTCYLAMLVTDWQVLSASFGHGLSDQAFRIDSGFVSTGVKVVSSWLCYLLFAWSVVAPWLFPNRDFS